MIDRTPLMNGMSVKQRAKYYDSLANPTNSEIPAMKKRDKGYVGMPIEQQKPEHKAPTMTKRAQGYTGKKLAQQSAGQKAPTMAKRAANYYASVKETDHLYAPNYQFKLQIGGYKISCKNISNLSATQEIEEVMEGGNNQCPNVFTNPGKKMSTLTIERALVEDKIIDEFTPGVYVTNGIISILRNRKPYREMYFDYGIVTKCEFSNLDALGSEIMLHKLEISHSGLY